MRGALTLLLGCLVLSSEGMAGQELPRPPELDDAVDFWTRIYTSVDSDHGLVHDRRDLSRIYARVPLPEPGRWRATRRRTEAIKDRYAEVLERLAEHGGQSESVLGQRVRALFPERVTRDELREAAARLRIQRGIADRFRAGVVRSGQWLGYIRGQLEAANVPPALAALPHVESSFQPHAASHAGAVGLWQFTKSTGRDFLRIDTVVDQRRDPWAASEAAAALLARNYKQLGDWGLAVTAYNHGANGMRRAMNELDTRSIAEIIEHYNGPYFGFASRNFYPALLAAASIDADPTAYFPGVERASPTLDSVRVPVADYMSAAAVADAFDVSSQQLRRLNPALREAVWEGRKFIPKGYRLRLPGLEEGRARQRLASVPPTSRYTRQRPDKIHVVRRGDTISGIADRYGVSMGALAAANGRGRDDVIRLGERLRLPLAGRAPRNLAEVSVADGGALYTVSRGDTLYAIAARFGVTVDQLVRINDLHNPDQLQPGQSLQVVPPDGMAAEVALADEG